MAEKEKRGGAGLVGNIIFILFAVGIFVGFGWKFFIAPPDDPILQMQGDPQSATRVYLDTAHEFRTGALNFPNVKKCVTEDDWNWFQENADRIYQEGDRFNISGGIDPTQAAALARQVILKTMILEGPNQKQAEIVRVEQDGDNAVAIVQQTDSWGGDSQFTANYKVRLRKEGKYWKVRDFAGGRAALEGRSEADDVVRVDPGGAAGPGGGRPPADGGGGGEAPGTLAEADVYLEKASAAWRAQQYQDALNYCQRAYAIRVHHLGENHPKVQEVRQMGQQARAMMQGGGGAAGGQ
ncbi:MAG: tetratricopeptide repeat protein [Sumerlaeia bacterium]